MDSKQLFNNYRMLSLILLIIAGCCGWLGMVLLTNPSNKPFCIDTAQKWGLLAAIILSTLAWFKKCLTIRPYEK